MDLREAIIARIHGLCQERHITPYQWSREAALPPNTMTSIRDGSSQNPGVITIKKLCDGIDMSVDEFFDHELFHALESHDEIAAPEDPGPPRDMHSAVSERLYGLCYERHLKPHQWSKRAGLSGETIKNIFYGRSKNTGIRLIKALCDAIGMSLTEFFDHDLFHNLEPEIENEPD